MSRPAPLQPWIRHLLGSTYLSLAVSVLAPACAGDGQLANRLPAPNADLGDLQDHLAGRLGDQALAARFDRNGERVLLAATPRQDAAPSESFPAFSLFEWNATSDDLTSVGAVVIDARYQDGVVVATGTDRVLRRHDSAEPRTLLDRVGGFMAVLTDQRLVVPRVSMTGGVPGTDLWLLPKGDGEGTVIARAPGFDELPFELPDGRVAFQSTRSTVASLWAINLESNSLSQLTNAGLVAGRKMDGFVPSPGDPSAITFAGDELRYDVAGTEVRIDLSTGNVIATPPVPSAEDQP